MNKEIFSRKDITSRTGEWWTIPWWQEDQYCKNSPFTKEEAETAFNELRKVFDAEWMLKQIPSFQHPIVYPLIYGGFLHFQFLCSLGLNLKIVREECLLGDLERRLKNPLEYVEAAVFELKFLSLFCCSGFEVTRHHKSDKGKHNCDFKITKGGETLYLEVKRPRNIHRHNEEAIQKGLSRLETFLFSDNNEKGGFIGEPLSPNSELSKVFRRIEYAVDYQIPTRGPGVVIVESPWV